MLLSTRSDRPDWQAMKPRIDLAALATFLLGPAPGRRGSDGKRLWWHCPLGTHEDPGPSFCIVPGNNSAKCFGCDKRVDAAELVKTVKRIDNFPEAVRWLADWLGGSKPTRSTKPSPKPTPPPKSKPVDDAPKGMSAAAAETILAESVERFRGPNGGRGLDYLTGPKRCLRPETIRAAGLGLIPVGREIGETFFPAGIAIPWRRQDGSLSLIKVRKFQKGGSKYLSPFHDKSRPLGLYPDSCLIKPGGPLILTEGEFDALLLGRELAGRAPVLTFGSTSNSIKPPLDVLSAMHRASPWYIGLDGDDAGQNAVKAWAGARVRVVKPPEPFKDWTEAHSAGVDLGKFWETRFWRDSPDLDEPPNVLRFE